ncbi:MAG TPA: ATP-binding protein, partial [Rhodocyclaceae bacterium]|nr:ATP-binding protein [Rhodocyclaceae bacterium]
KYTDRGEVGLHLYRRDDRIRFEVRDTGPGIAPEDRERIFQAFYQAPGGAGKGGGTGLGLTISRQFVQLMGGELAVSSEVGQGSCFSFEIALPPAPAPAQPVPSGHVTGLAPGQKACRVLVAEDDADGRELVTRLLESVGFQVRTVENGEQAVAAFQDWKPDFICLDMRMPVLDGYQAAARIRALPGGREVAIAALTGSTIQQDRDAILAAGCDDMVLKPIAEDQLFAVIGRLLGLGFTYSGKESGAAAVPTEADLSALPAEVRAELGRAAEMLDREAVGKIVDHLRPQFPDQARTIAALVDNYHFDRLLELCSPLEEKR